jgi:VWFA-related protein
VRTATGLLAAAACGLAAIGEAQAPPVFGVKVETVYVDVFVTHRGQHVAGLRAEDFDLKDNGARQRVELVAAESVPLLALLVFDTSGSVAGEKLTALRTSGRAFLEGLRPGDEAALLTFSHEIEWRAGPSADRAAIVRALDGVRADGATSAMDALFAGLTLPETRARTLVLLFSDGEDNLSWLGEDEVRAAAERSNALIHVVTVQESRPRMNPGAGASSVLQGYAGLAGEPEYVRALRRIAEATGGRLWEAESPDRIRGAFAAIAEAMNQRYILRYEPAGVKRPGWHQIEVDLRGKKGDVHARRGYWVGAR